MTETVTYEATFTEAELMDELGVVFLDGQPVGEADESWLAAAMIKDYDSLDVTEREYTFAETKSYR